MTTVYIKTESHFTVDRDRIRNLVSRLLSEKGVAGKTEVSINIVGDRMMRELNNRFRKIDNTTDVLSFPLEDDEGKIPFADIPDGILRLGDIVISYPQAREDAIEDNKMMDDKIDELIEHGLMHLLGQHHD